MGPRQAAVQVRAAATPSSYPAFFMAGSITTPMATAVATAAPEIAAKMAQARMVAWPRPPRIWPRSVRAKFTRSGVRPPSFMRLPASMNRGMARRGKLVNPPKVVWIRVVMGTVPPTRAYIREHPPRATVMGAEMHRRMMKAARKMIMVFLFS